jgi:glycosyltransferase involved in cell wall biosynthesis
MDTNVEQPLEPRVLICAFDTPYPVDYGGVYDVHSRAVYLRASGYAVDVICLVRDEGRIAEFQRRMESEPGRPYARAFFVRYRPRYLRVLGRDPFAALVRDVELDDATGQALRVTRYDFVVVEHLKMARFARRLRAVVSDAPFYLRAHNDEYEFHQQLAASTRSVAKRLYLRLEALKYRDFQRAEFSGPLFSRVFFIGERDYAEYRQQVRGRAVLLPIFCDLPTPVSVERRGGVRDIDFLYVGNLDSGDNVQALMMALAFVKSLALTDVNVMVCGKFSQPAMEASFAGALKAVYPCEVCFNVDRSTLDAVYARAKCFLNFSANIGGVKTKLVEALSSGLLVVSNREGVLGSSLEQASLLASDLTSDRVRRLLSDDDAYEQQRSQFQAEFLNYARTTRMAYEREFVHGGAY